MRATIVTRSVLGDIANYLALQYRSLRQAEEGRGISMAEETAFMRSGRFM